MATKAIKGHKKGTSSSEIVYFLSHGDTVILGSGNSKQKLSTKLDNIDGTIGNINAALGKRATVQDIASYLPAMPDAANHMPMADVYTNNGKLVEFISGGSSIIFKIPNWQYGVGYYAKFNKVENENAWLVDDMVMWDSLTDIEKSLFDEGHFKAEAIDAKIPDAASSSNKLADKEWVNTQVANKTVDSSHIDNNAVTTAKIADGNVTKAKLANDVLNFLEEYLADFKGTVITTAALKALTGNKNDWAVLQTTDANGNTVYSRYRYDENYNDATTGHWKFELNINSSSFTAAQWAAINSAITAEKVTSYDNHLANGDIHVTDIQRMHWNHKAEPLNYSHNLSQEIEPNLINSEDWIPFSDGLPAKVEIDHDSAQDTLVFLDHNGIFTIYTLDKTQSESLWWSVFNGSASELGNWEDLVRAMFPEFFMDSKADAADLGGYEFDEVDVENDIL